MSDESVVFYAPLPTPLWGGKGSTDSVPCPSVMVLISNVPEVHMSRPWLSCELMDFGGNDWIVRVLIYQP